MMRIGLVLSQVPGYSETFFRNKIKLLLHLGHQVILFSENPQKIRIEGVRVVEPFNLSKRLSFDVMAQIIKALLICLFIIPIRSWRFIMNELNDKLSLATAFGNLLVNVHILRYSLDWLHFGFATMAIKRENVGKTIKAKVAVSFRGYDIAVYPVKHPGCYYLLWQKIDKVHTISSDLLEVAYSHGMPRHIPVEKITPAIDTRLFNNPFRTGIISKKIRILSVGRLHWKKGYEYAFSALVILKQRNVDFELSIVGDGEEYERLFFSAWQSGLSSDVTFLGRLPHNKIPALMQAFDVYIQPSVQEGFCNSVLEAQCNGLFCIVSDAEGLAENVINGQTGIVVPKRSPDAIVEAIERFTSMTPGQRLDIIQNAQKRVEGNFSLEMQMKQFKKFYND